MTNESMKLAKLWTSLGEIKNKLDNEIIPVGGYLGIDDPDLMIAMEELSEKIGNTNLVKEDDLRLVENRQNGRPPKDKK